MLRREKILRVNEDDPVFSAQLQCDGASDCSDASNEADGEDGAETMCSPPTSLVDIVEFNGQDSDDGVLSKSWKSSLGLEEPFGLTGGVC